MKQKLLSIKTLLVAAMLGVGVNSAWATPTSLYERGTTNAWATADLDDWAQSYCTATISGGLSVNTTNAGWTCTKSISVTANAIVTLDATLKTGGASGRSGSYDYIQIGGVSIRFNEQDQVASVDIDGVTTNLTKLTYSRNTAYVIQVVIDQATGDVSYTVGSVSGTGSSSTAITNVVFGHSKAGKENYAITSVLQKIEVQEEPQVVTNVGYTINYNLGEEIVKTVSTTSIVGAIITSDVAVDGEGTFAGNHYLITAADAPSMTLVADAASNVLNVPVRAPYTATLSVTWTIGGVAETPVVTDLTETDAKVCSWTYTYPMYVQKGGIYYVADETASFGESGVFTNGQTITKTVSYTNPDYSVVYFSEPNEVAGTNTTYSNGSTGYITGGVVYSSDKIIRLGQLPAGTYRLITNVTGDSNRNVVVGDYTAGTESFPTALVTVTTTGAKDETFTVDGTQLICISGKDQGSGKFNQSATIDYILVKASAQKKTISAAGWATYCSPYALDFSSAIDNLDAAYIVTGGADGVLAKTEVTGTVPAGAGLLLKGSAGTITIPVVANGDASNVAGNKLVGVTANTVIDAEDGYVLMNDATNGLGFYKNRYDFTVGANTAYLPAGFATDGTRSFFLLDGETTGVNDVRGKMEDVRGAVYNLAGQRVAQPTKGLYIVNGKKYVVK
jgi:hypothetical protein